VNSGRVKWPADVPMWTFLWEVTDNDTEGIAFRDVFFRGKKVLHKASLPMIRVQYDSGNGPYKDRLRAGNMKHLKVYEFGQPSFLVVESYHHGGDLGRYHIVNRWLFLRDGVILPQLMSAGLQHPSTHRHHCYWRFDFDILGESNNLALQHAHIGTDWGYGPGWIPKVRELSTIHIADNVLIVRNKLRNMGYVIRRGDFDGASDAFSRLDVAITRYHGPEDMKGALGTARDDQIWKHVNGEDVDGQDLVMWYVAHLQHHVHDNGDEWHVCGPILSPFGY
jgi:hypothetical protein